MCLQFHVKRRPLKKINVPAISREAPALKKKKKKKKKKVSQCLAWKREEDA
jgi:hypothetical protein